MKRTGTVLVRDDSRYAYKRSKTSIPRSLTPRLTYAKKSPRVELKSVYEGIGPFSPQSNPANLISYGAVDAGDAFNQRNGKLIRHIDQSWLGRFDLGPAYDSVTFRVIHGVWNDANDPVVTSDILALTAPSSPDSWIAPYNVQASRKYVILGDEFITINNTGSRTVTGVQQPCAGQKFVKRKYSYKRLQEYQGNSAAQVVDWTHFYGVIVTAGGGTAEIMHTVNFVDV